MVWWDRQLKKMLEEENIILHMYRRNVDDINIVVDKLVPNDDTDSEEYTINSMMTIANNIHNSIKVKEDHPSRNENKRLPILDVEMWIDEVNVEGINKRQILYSHYIKPMSNRVLVHKESAMSYVTKINILLSMLHQMKYSQKAVRLLKN